MGSAGGAEAPKAPPLNPPLLNKLLTQKLLEPTNDIYAVLLQGSGQCLRFRFRKANILFAFLVILVRWGSHLRSSDIKIPK